MTAVLLFFFCCVVQLKRQVCSALAQIAKHSVDLAEVVVEAEIFPKVCASRKLINVSFNFHLDDRCWRC